MEEAKGMEDGREEGLLGVVVQESKFHKVEVSNFSRMLNPKDLIDLIRELEDDFEFEDVKDPGQSSWHRLS